MSGKRAQIFSLLAAAAASVLPAFAGTATAVVGHAAKFSVAANGTAPFSYQWSKNNLPISGAVSSTYSINAVTPADAGTYTVLVSNSAGSALSDASVLNVTPANTPAPTPPPPAVPIPVAGHLTNLSVRGSAGSEQQTLIVGFIVTGSSSLPVLIRGWGPALATSPFNIPGTLADPVLHIFHDATQVTENDNWGNDPQIAAVTGQVGAFPFSPTGKDAAVYTRFLPGANTAHVVGATSGSGVTLAEVYDANTVYLPGSTRLTNLSARAKVGVGAEVLIGGFAIGGQTSLTLLIRAVGPTLANFGVNGVLADPKLELHSSTALLQTNDNWSEAANASTIATLNTQQAFALPANSKDAVILVTLPPGVYSAVVAGVNNTTGTTLLEVYEVQ